MSAIERIQHELDLQGIKPAQMMKELGFSSGLYSQWKSEKQNPSLSKLETISDYLQVDLFYLRQDELREKAVSKYGFCYTPEEAELIKNNSREVIYSTDDESVIFNEAITVFKALFSRSLFSCEYDLKHVDFDTYVAMLLKQNFWKEKYSLNIYNALVEKFGTQDGIPEGTSYNTSKRKITTNKPHQSISNDDLKFALFNGSEGVTDEMFDEVKQFAEMVKMRENAKRKEK